MLDFIINENIIRNKGFPLKQQNMEYQTQYYCIAEHYIGISFIAQQVNLLKLIPSLNPFRCEKPSNNKELLAKLFIDNTLQPIDKSKCELIRNFDTGNGMTLVDRLPNGGYQYIIHNIKEEQCCLLQTDKDFQNCKCAISGDNNMQNFGLNNALMLIYAFASSKKDTLLIHASLVRNNGYGYAFIAKSGTGKSTQVSMWLRYIKGSDLMNDDNPNIRIINGALYIYGSPWSGKTPCYRKIKAKLGAITHIDRAQKNSIEKLSTINAFAALMPSCSTMKWDETITDYICHTIEQLIATTGIYTLHCLPNQEAAEICYNTIAK